MKEAILFRLGYFKQQGVSDSSQFSKTASDSGVKIFIRHRPSGSDAPDDGYSDFEVKIFVEENEKLTQWRPSNSYVDSEFVNNNKASGGDSDSWLPLQRDYPEEVEDLPNGHALRVKMYKTYDFYFNISGEGIDRKNSERYDAFSDRTLDHE